MPDLIKLLIGPAALSLTNHKAQYTADTLTLQLFVLNYLLFISPFSLAESLLFGSCAFVTSPQSVEGRYTRCLLSHSQYSFLLHTEGNVARRLPCHGMYVPSYNCDRTAQCVVAQYHRRKVCMPMGLFKSIILE